MSNRSNVVLRPDTVALMRERGLFTRGQPSGYGTDSGIGWWACACGHTNDPVNSTCERCGVSGKPGEAKETAPAPENKTPPGEPTYDKHFACRGCGDPMGPYEHDDEYPGDCGRCFADRKKEWGDMRTSRPPTDGPILVTGKPGHVELHLELLSDDREKAMAQIFDALKECTGHAAKWGGVLENRTLDLSYALISMCKAIDVGWKLAPYLQRVRDAHEAIGMERRWKEGKVEPCKGNETLAEMPEMMLTHVAEAGQPKPGWEKR